ncbi:MAG: peptide chain release factor N(5)-glutamine methyltransferase [Candidatus Tumulicola sp.]
MPGRPAAALARASSGNDATIATLLRQGIAVLAPSSESPRADAMLLLAHALERDRAWILAHGEAGASKALTRRFEVLCRERATGVPLAYVVGSAGFYGREFAVDRRVLVPRPETEHLVDEALAFLRRRSQDRRGRSTVLDVGVGSGAIACTIAAEHGSAFVEGTDVSPGALEVARFNADRLGVGDRCRFHQGRFAEPVEGRRFELVVANLPYVPSPELPPAPSSTAFEPRQALDGGADGLQAYREFLPVVPQLLEPTFLILFEAAPPQMAGLVRLAKRTFPGATIAVGSDFAGNARYLKLAAAAP